MSEHITNIQAFRLKGRLYTFTVLLVLNADKDIFAQQFAEIIVKAPKFFDNTPVVFDLSAVHHLELDLQALFKIARDHGMIPVAIQGGNHFQETLAQCQGIAVLNSSVLHDKSVNDHSNESTVVELIKTNESGKSKLIDTPVRSGRQVVAKGSDLIITASVSHGAELLADGSIHVYGALRGRALAGISGNTEARIFCQSLEAELVSIAGFYRLSDAIDPIQGPCQIYLKDEHIHIEAL